MTDPTPAFPAGTFSPDPVRASLLRMVSAQTRFELRLLVRNGEQLLVALIIPIAVLIGLTVTGVFDLSDPRVASAVPGVFALAAVSTCFTSLAIATAFDRRYLATKRLAAAGVPRWLLISGKIGGCLLVVIGQLVVLSAVALVLGWEPDGPLLWLLPWALLGVAAVGGLGLLLGGTLRAEAVLALANIIWFLFVAIGGVLTPLADAPGWVGTIGALTPVGALSEGFRDILTDGTAPSVGALLVLGAWLILGWTSSIRWFKWQ